MLVKLLDNNLHLFLNMLELSHVHIAQLDRAFPSEGKGRGFNSHYEHHNKIIRGKYGLIKR